MRPVTPSIHRSSFPSSPIPVWLVLLMMLAKADGTHARDMAWTPLFNGRDLEGWVNVNCAPDTFRATNGVIFCTGFPTGELRTRRMYQNFALELEWRHLRPQGNAGVFVWADALTAPGQPFIRAVEVQVLDGREGPGHTSDGDIFPIHGARMIPENGRGGDRAFPTEKRMKPSPEWNHYRIECTNGAIALAVNGKVVTRGREASPRKGYICLESEGSPIEFRNLRIQEWPVEKALAPDHIARPDEHFVSLYNGLDLTGWLTRADTARHWRAQDWVLDHDGKKGEGDPHLWTEEEFGDFVLVADWRWTAKPVAKPLPVIRSDGTRGLNPDGSEELREVLDAGDSGIYLRGDLNSEVNIWCWPVGSGELFKYREDVKRSAEARAAATPKRRADKPPGQWNRFVVTLRGNRVSVELNGERVIDQAELDGIPHRGRIGLQHHGSPIQFANLFIKRLD
ncbi:MAG: DUF1080 domain-containing protein [Verrucomicrobia bacterium]|nr:DUF1080 domain-containing protein [Verrucomicrobiota bacterium]